MNTTSEASINLTNVDKLNIVLCFFKYPAQIIRDKLDVRRFLWDVIVLFVALLRLIKSVLTYLHSCQFYPVYIIFCDIQTDRQTHRGIPVDLPVKKFYWEDPYIRQQKRA
jgi:hypothetical protein